MMLHLITWLCQLILSADLNLVAMLGSAIATCISDIPFDGPCAMTQVGMVDGEFVVNPSVRQQWQDGDLTAYSCFNKAEGYYD